MSKTTVFFSFAHNFWSHTAVAASSAMEHANNLDIHIFSDRVNDRWLGKLKAKAKAGDSTIHNQMRVAVDAVGGEQPENQQ